MSIDNLKWWEWVGFLASAQDGAVARELLGPACARPVQQLAEGVANTFHLHTPFRLPKMRLTTQTMEWAVEHQPTPEAAEVINFVLQVTNSRTAAMWALVASHTRKGERYRLGLADRYQVPQVLIERFGYDQVPTSGAIARRFDGVTALGSKGPRDSPELNLDAPWASQLGQPFHAGSKQEHNIRAATKLGRHLWRELGDDPGAWELALDLLDNPDATAREAVEATRATVESRAERKSSSILTPWRFRRPVHLFHDDYPVEGPQDRWGLSHELRTSERLQRYAF